MRLSILGAGSWGTALALYLHGKGHQVTLWVYEADLLQTIRERSENTVFLPGFPLPPDLHCTHDLHEAVGDTGLLILAVPAQHLRSILREARPLVRSDLHMVNTAKGIEKGTLKRMSEVVGDEIGSRLGAYAALSGPTFAGEVARRMPTAAVFAGKEAEFITHLQEQFSSALFRFYRTDDLAGVEMAGALKNVYAIASGILKGLDFGSNPWAAMLTRAVHEMTRLCIAIGGKRETLSGLAGLGDLLLTCTSQQSRNFRVGEQIGRGGTLEDILASTRMVAEGVPTCEAAPALAERYKVELPIAGGVADILFHRKDPREVSRELMTRSLKSEAEL